MILQALHALHERLQNDPDYGIAPPGYSNQKITFKVVLYPDGRLFGIQDATLDGKPRQERVLGTAKSPGSGINPCCLWDNTGYMLGFKPDDAKPERTRETFEGFRKWHLDREREINAPAFSAVCRFLENWSPQRAAEFPVLAQTKSGFGVFQFVAQPAYVHQDSVIDAWWRKRLASEHESGPEGQCLLTGATGPVTRLQPMIKGIAGGNAQCSLVGFNDPAYCSYGKEQSFNAPVGEEAAFRYGAALNALLDGPMRHKHRMILADTTVAFWTERPCIAEDIFAKFADHGDVALSREGESQDTDLLHKLEIFVRSLRKGVEAYGDLGEETDEIQFYMLGLSPNQGRLAVRLFLRGTVRELLDNLRRHYRDMAIDSNGPGDRPLPGIWQLLDETCPRNKKTRKLDRDRIPPVLAGPLARAVISGARYPDAFYSAVLRRIRADRAINYIRACIIKGYLVRNRNQEVSMSLDRERGDPAYRLGRLFAALEKTQEDALGNVGASVRDRFYSAASATPGSVFPRLLRTYQHHLAKLAGGLKVVREQLVQEILCPLTGFPAHFGLREQGLFALGYYHQKKDFYTSKKDRKQGDEE